jgi:cytochrome c-type biogenesis protein CcmH
LAAAQERLADPRLEARAEKLQRSLRCVVCQGESLDESNAPLAADLRHLIRKELEKGWSDAQITDYLVARYGAFILMRPPFDPETYLLWLGPLIALSVGGAAAAAVVLRAHRKARAEEP